jgi:hypothetical protein
MFCSCGTLAVFLTKIECLNIHISGDSLSSDDSDDDYLYGQTRDVDGIIDKWHDVVALTDSDGEGPS